MRAAASGLLGRIYLPIQTDNVDHSASQHRDGLDRSSQTCSPKHFARASIKCAQTPCLDANRVLAKNWRRSDNLAGSCPPPYSPSVDVERIQIAIFTADHCDAIANGWR